MTSKQQLLRPLIEIIGKSQPACRILRLASFCRFFPAYQCLPAEPVRIVVAVHSNPMTLPVTEGSKFSRLSKRTWKLRSVALKPRKSAGTNSSGSVPLMCIRPQERGQERPSWLYETVLLRCCGDVPGLRQGVGRQGKSRREAIEHANFIAHRIGVEKPPCCSRATIAKIAKLLAEPTLA